MNRQRILMIFGYNAFFWCAFWLFAYWTFPYQRLSAFITDKVAESGAGYTLEIGALAPYWFSGVELEQVQVRKTAADTLATPTVAGEKPPPAQTIKIDSAQARLSLMSLLTGTKSVSFSAEMGDGEVDGQYSEGGEERKVVAKLEAVDLAKFAVLESLVSLPMRGTLTGDFDLTLGQVPTKTQGSVKLTISKLTIGDGKAKLKVGTMGGLTIDPINAGDVNIEIDVKDGVGTVKKMLANGTDLKLIGSGDVRFAQPLARSRLNILLKVALTEAYKNKSSRTKAMFALLDSGGAPQVVAAKTGDGSFQFRLSGMMSAVRALPAGTGGGAAANMAAPIAQPVTATPEDEE